MNDQQFEKCSICGAGIVFFEVESHYCIGGKYINTKTKETYECQCKNDKKQKIPLPMITSMSVGDEMI